MELDYIIIGSGIAGLHTAYRLQQQGKKVLVLEKEFYLGGRMSTRSVQGKLVDFGAKFIAKNLYKNMLFLSKELGVEPIPINLTDAGIRKAGRTYIFKGSKRLFAALIYRGISLKAKLQLALACATRVFQYRKLNFYRLEDMLDLDDKSVYGDFRKFAGPEGYDHAIELFSQNIVFYPTKEFSRLAFYSVLVKLIRLKPFTFPEGIGQLCKIMAAKLPVELNMRVIGVERVSAGVKVSAVRGEEKIELTAKKAVIAVPGNSVLSILKNPLPEEKGFFSEVRYASTVQIFCEAKTDIFSQVTVVEILPSEKSNFTALGKGGAKKDAYGKITFIAALRAETYKELTRAGTLTPEHLKELIIKEFSDLSELKILGIQIWDSATPIMYPGYIKKMAKFLCRSSWNNNIYFCGDYLENPSTEGALTSSVRLLEKLKLS